MVWLEKNDKIPHANIAFNKNGFRIVTNEEVAKETEDFMGKLLENYWKITALHYPLA